MKARFCLLLVLILVLTGCATTAANKQKQKDEAVRIRQLGEAFLAEKKYTPAYRELMRALDLDPANPHVHYDLGLFYYEKKKHTDAIKEYQKALALKPDFASARNNLGVVYMEQKEWDKAIETLSSITEDYLYATPHFPHFLIGQACFNKGDFQQAQEHFQESLELQPDFFFAAHWLGKTYLEMGNSDQAIRALEKAVNMTPAAVFLLDLGRAYVLAGDLKKAEEAFGQAASLATDPALKEEALRQQGLLRKKTGSR